MLVLVNGNGKLISAQTEDEALCHALIATDPFIQRELRKIPEPAEPFPLVRRLYRIKAAWVNGEIRQSLGAATLKFYPAHHYPHYRAV